MQVFEFHFNPPKKHVKSDLIFDSFCYEPANFHEKKLGSLYLIGALRNALPQNSRFLDNLAKVIQEKYYQTTSAGSEKSLKESLKRANLYLDSVSKKGDVSWLGNLSFATLSLNLNKKSAGELNFTKIGDLKIYLMRNGEITDIDKKLKLEEIEPYPLKVFGNIVSGKLAEKDIVFVLTKQVADFFTNQNLFKELAKIDPFDRQKINKLLDNKKEELLKISGIFLLILCTSESSLKGREFLVGKKKIKLFSFKEALAPIYRIISIPKEKVKFLIQTKKNISSKNKRPATNSLHSLALPNISLPKLNIDKNILLILVLLFTLSLGFFLFERQEKQQLKSYQAQYEQIKLVTEEAKSYLILAETNPAAENKANLLFKESLDQLSPLLKISSALPADFADKILDLEKNIIQNLYQLNDIQAMDDIQPHFVFETREFTPQNIVYLKGNVYSFSSFSKNVYEISADKKEQNANVIPTENRFNMASQVADSIIFFSKPNHLNRFKDGRFEEKFDIETPYANFNFIDFSSYLSNLYFLDGKNGEIVKYPFLNGTTWDLPQLWLNQKIKKTINAKSIAANGVIWVLNKNNALEKYYSGNLQETISLDIFPPSQGFDKIITSPTLSYLYLSDPAEKRIVILDKFGKLVKQIRSEKFNKLSDFTVSDNGKNIFILNGTDIFRIDL